MKDANKGKYTQMILDLIYFEDEIKEAWANIDKKALRNIIEIIRFYRQFSNN